MKTTFYAIVTGAGSGLGAEVSALLLAQNIPTIVVGRKIDKLIKLTNGAIDTPCIPVVADISKEEEIAKIFLAGQALNMPLGLVVNCAGHGVFGPLGSYSTKDINDVLSANLIGTILIGQRSFLEMKGSGGTIVMVMSTAATVGKANESIYCAAKWGARGFAEALRAEAKSTPVNVLSVYPGGMKTPFWDEAVGPTPDVSQFMDPKEVAETILANVLNKRTLSVTELTINRPAR